MVSQAHVVRLVSISYKVWQGMFGRRWEEGEQIVYRMMCSVGECYF